MTALRYGWRRRFIVDMRETIARGSSLSQAVRVVRQEKKRKGARILPGNPETQRQHSQNGWVMYEGAARTKAVKPRVWRGWG